MKPVPTPDTNFTYKLAGGDESNDLPCFRSGGKVISTWELSDEELAAIKRTKALALFVWWPNHVGCYLAVGGEQHDGESMEWWQTEDEDHNRVLGYGTKLSDEEIAYLDDKGTIELMVDMQPPPPVSIQVGEPGVNL